MPTCEYIADTRHENSYGHTDAEVFSVYSTRDGIHTVTCTAEATRVIRPKGSSISLGDPRRQKFVVCEDHGVYLTNAPRDERPDFPRLWEFDAMEPETVMEELVDA